MQAKLLSGLLVLLMLTSAMPVLADPSGPWIQVNSIQDGDILTVKTVDVNGTAAPSPDNWNQHTLLEFKAGSFNNMTLTKNGALTPKPYIGDIVKDANNPIVDYGAIGEVNEYGAQFGAIIKDGDTFEMWAMGLNNSYAYNLMYLVSDDGASWNIQNGTLTLGGHGAFDEVALLPGTVIKEGATYKMWYTGEDIDGIYTIGYATSSDGIDWTKGNNGEPVINIGPVNKFDGGGAAMPSVIKDGATYKMWYAGMISYSDSLFQIGYATSVDGITWARAASGEPVLTFGKPTGFDADGLLAPTVIKDGPTYRMWYLGINGMSMGGATSSDGITWTLLNDDAPVMISDSGTFDEYGITGIAALRTDNKYEFYYTGLDGAYQYRIGHAEANLEGLTGIFQSDIFVAEYKVNWNEINATFDTPTGTTLTLATRSSNDRVDWTAWTPVSNGKNHWTNYKFMQYQITMTTPDALSLPTVSAVDLEFEAIERVEVSLDNNTWFIATGTYTWNITMYMNEGPNRLYVRIMDTTNKPTYKVMDLVVDTIKPTGTLQINQQSIYTTNRTVQLAISAVDARGVSKLRMATTLQGLENQTWQDYNSSQIYTLPALDGLVTVYAQVLDSTGWESNVFSDSILLDTTPPNATVVINDGAPIATLPSVTLTLAATDLNGVTDMRVANTDDFSNIDWKPYTRVINWQLDRTDGVKTVYVEYRDRAGNSKVYSGSILLDTTPPTGTLVINNGDALTTARLVNLTMNAQDKNGISYVMLSNDPDFLVGLWVKYNKTMAWTLPEILGMQTVYAKFKDTAGLVSPVVLDTIILDIHEEGFQGNILLNNGDQYASNQTLTAQLDLVGGDASAQVMLSESPDFTGAVWGSYTQTTTFKTDKTDGTVTVYAKFKDKYGIISTATSDSIIVDTAAPMVTLQKPKMNAKVDNGKITVVGTASDNHALRTVEVQLPNGAWMPVDNPKAYSLDIYLPKKATYTIMVRATDEAGNVGTTSVTIKYVQSQSSGMKIPGFETGALMIAVLAVALVLMRRKKN
jgi:hypothetical protein